MKTLVAAAPYLLTAGLIYFLAVAPSQPGRSHFWRSERLAWKIICGMFLLIAALRPYGVHSQVTEVLRTSAITSGWYDQRSHQQMDLVYVTAFATLVLGLFLLHETRRWQLASRLALFALCYLLGLLLMNILSLHGWDAMLSRSFAGISLRWALELPGLVCALAAAHWLQRKPST